MGWGGIANLPPGFDVFGGKGGQLTIVERAIRGDVKGLSPGQQDLFKDLKRNLMHMDFARYFESTVVCAEVLKDLDGGAYRPAVRSDIVEPALHVALEQMESIRRDLQSAASGGRRVEYDPQASLDHLYRKARPIAVAYPDAKGADQLETVHTGVTGEIARAKDRSSSAA